MIMTKTNKNTMSNSKEKGTNKMSVFTKTMKSIKEKETNKMSAFTKTMKSIKEIAQLINSDLEKMFEANSYTEFASLDLAIDCAIEKIEFIKICQENYLKYVESQKEIIQLAIEDERKAVKNRTDFRKYKVEVEVRQKALGVLLKQDKKMEKMFTEYVTKAKEILALSIKKRDKLYSNLEVKLKECEGVENIYDVIVEIREEMRVANLVKEKWQETGAKIGSYTSNKGQLLKELVSIKGEKENAFANQSKLDQLQPSLMGVFMKAAQKMGQSTFVTESKKHLGHILIKYENYVIKFDKKNFEDYYIYVGNTPMIHKQELMCSGKEVEDLISTLGRLWREI